jgi:sugar lactone lactonase YvrE
MLLGSAPSWASFSLTFQGLVQTMNTGGSITLSSPAGVVVDSACNVDVADTGNNRIVEVSALGVASVLTINGLTPALSSPNGIAIDGSGNLYIADTGNSRVVKVDTSGNGTVVSAGSVTLSSPKGVALDQTGDIFIADTGNNRVVEVTSGGAAAALTITVSSGSSTLSSPKGLGVSVGGKLYIADSGNNRVVSVAAGSTTGVVVSILGGVTLSSPSSVQVDGIGNVIIADTGNDRIAEVDTSSNGTVLYTDSVTLSGPLAAAVDVFGTVYVADTGDNQGVVVDPPVNGDLGSGDPTYSLNKSAVGFGHVQLGSASPVTLTLPFTTGSVGLGAVKVFSFGTQTLDFTSGVDTTCNGSTGASSYCTVQVSFLPTAPGLRTGAVVLYDTSQNPILTLPLYGFSDSPVAALAPNTGAVISTGGLTLSNPFQLALDGTGNMYVGDYTGKNVTKIAAGGGSAAVVTLGTPGSEAVQNITGVAVDGAGNLFIGDHQNSRILVVTPGGVVSVLTITGLSPSLGFPVALAFDGAGNLFVADFTESRIVEISTLVVAGSTSSGNATVIGTGSYSFGSSTLTGMTIDSQENIYIAARTDNSSSIIKVTAAGVASELAIPGNITPAISNPQGVGVDAMGNLYIVDSGNDRIVKITTAGVASVLSISGLPSPSSLGSTMFGVTVDPSGNLYISDWSNSRIVFVNVSGAVLTFASTNVGLTSSDSPKTATVTNLGDQALVIAATPTYTANFSQAPSGTNQCLTSTTVSAGTVCNVTVQFTPQAVGSLSAGITVTDNTLNVSGSTQQVSVSGTGLNPGDTTAVVVSTNPTAANIGQPLTVTAIVTDTTAGHTATIPTGGVTFMDTVGSTVISLNGGAAVTLNGTGQAILTGVTLSGAGVHTITANYAGVVNTFLASSTTTTLTVTKDSATIAGPPTQPVPVAVGQAGSVPITVTGPYTVVAAPTGSLNYNVLNSSNTSVASGTAPLTPGETDSAATVPILNSLAPGSYTVSVTYAGDGNYAASSSATTIQVVVGLITPTINWTQPAPITYGATLGGVLNASAVSGSTTVAGSFVYTATPQGGIAVTVTGATVLSAGDYTLTAMFTPTDTSTYTSASGTVSLTVTKATPAVALISSVNPAPVTMSVTFTATVSSSAGTPSGSVSFYNGTTLLGAGTMAQGVATYTTASLPVGAFSITAAYGGDANFAALTSSALTEMVTTSYAVTGPATPTSVAPGGAATIDIAVPPLGGSFNNVVTLSATGLPPGATATFNPPTVTPGSAGEPTVLTVQLAAVTASLPARSIPTRRRGLPVAPFSLALVMFGTVLGRKRISRTLALSLALAGLGVTSLLLTSCGGGFSNTPPATDYTITVTGTSGTFQASTTVTLVVE